MLYVPSIFGESLMDDWFGDFDHAMDRMERGAFGRRNPLYGKNAARMMKTDVKELEDGYVIDMDLPGFKKEDLKLELSEGYLTITAAKAVDHEKKAEGKVIRQERYSGSMTRSFYVGEAITEEDIKAKYENGVLELRTPKIDPAKKVEEKKYIAIEG